MKFLLLFDGDLINKLNNDIANIKVIMVRHAAVTPIANSGVLPYKYHIGVYLKKSDIPSTYTYNEAYLCSVLTNDNSKGCAVSIITNDSEQAYVGISSYYGSQINVYGMWLLK